MYTLCFPICFLAVFKQPVALFRATGRLSPGQRHTQINAEDIRNQPDKPDNQTETIEIPFRLFRPPEIRPNSPEGMHKHQEQRDQAGNRMQVILYMRQLRNMFHQSRTDCIGKQTGYEKDQVPGTQFFLQPFAPYPDRIKTREAVMTQIAAMRK